MRLPHFTESRTVLRLARPAYEHSLQDPAHTSKHILRVLRIAHQIAEGVQVDLRLLEPAVILHDVYRPASEVPGQEVMDGTLSRAQEILEQVGYVPDEQRQILQAISTHSRSSLQEQEKTSLGTVLYDADKLDGIGAHGVRRAASYGEARGWTEQQTASWYLGRVLDVVRNEPLYHDKSKHLAIRRLTYSLSWCKKRLPADFDGHLQRHGYADARQVRF